MLLIKTLTPGSVVLFQGDSITNAFRKPEEVGTSYRLGSGWAMIVAANLQAEFPEMQLKFENRGVSGNGLTDLLARWQKDCLALKPAILSVLVGVNEVLRDRLRPAVDISAFESYYRQLLEMTRRNLPQIRLVLCEPFLLPSAAVGVSVEDPSAVAPELCSRLRPCQRMVRQLAEEWQAVFVPLQEPLERAAAKTGPDYWLFDGVHPNAAGQWIIAREWLSAVAGITL